MRRFLYKNDFLKAIIEEDVVGFYLIIYNDPSSAVSSQDFLLDSLDDTFQKASERFGIPKEKWILEKVGL